MASRAAERKDSVPLQGGRANLLTPESEEDICRGQADNTLQDASSYSSDNRDALSVVPSAQKNQLDAPVTESLRDAEATRPEHPGRRKSTRETQEEPKSESLRAASDRSKFVDRALLSGCRRVSEYRRLNKISEGTYGCVYKAQLIADASTLVALKYIKYHGKIWQEGFPLTSLREIAILLELRHPNIVNVIEVVVGPNPNHVFVVLEYVEHELKVLLEDDRPCFSVSERKTLLHQLLQAVAYMHENWVIHRDIKSSNLLYSNRGMLKVCDFGMARKFGDPIRPYTHNVITMWYRAPELLLGQTEYSEAVDMWSVGCIMGELFLRKPLFEGKNEVETLDKIFHLCGTPCHESWPEFSSLPLVAERKLEFASHPPSWRQTFPHPRTHLTELSALSEEGLDLISSLLCLNPATRIRAVDALKHRFFRESPLPQRQHLMPTVPDTNATSRTSGNQPHACQVGLDDEDRALYHDRDSRYLFGSRINPARYLREMDARTRKLKQQVAQATRKLSR